MEVPDRKKAEHRVTKGKRPQGSHVPVHDRVEADVGVGANESAQQRDRPRYGMMPDPQPLQHEFADGTADDAGNQPDHEGSENGVSGAVKNRRSLNDPDKRLDVLASVIKRNGTIYDLADFEHAYAPPYSSAKDPVNMAGFVAENILLTRLNVFYWNELDREIIDGLLIDVRTPAEYEGGKIGDAINIPVDDIRSRLDEIPRNKKILIYCEAGLRGYLAQRILKQNGFDEVLNLSGGYRLWNNCVNELNLNW